MITRRQLLLAAVAAPFISASLTVVAAEPSVFEATKPIRMVVPFPPGGGNDLLARIVSKSSLEVFSQPMVVENRAGAGGAIGTQAVARSASDGYTIEMASVDTNTIYHHLYDKPNYVGTDFPGVAPVAKVELVLVARPGLEANNLKELLELSRTKQLTYASWGIGTVSNLAMVAFMKATGVPEYLHVPYQGAAPAVLAALSGEVDLVMAVMPLAKPQPSLKPFGVFAAERSTHMPNVPTLKEQGFELELEAWIGIVAPPKTPDDVVQSLGAGFAKVVEDAELIEALDAGGFTPFKLSTTEFQEYLKAQDVLWGGIVKDANIKLD